MGDIRLKEAVGTDIKRTRGLSVKVWLRDGCHKRFYFSNDLVKFLMDDLYRPQSCSPNTLSGLWKRGIIHATPSAPTMRVMWPLWKAQQEWNKTVARDHHWTLNPFGVWLVQEIHRWICNEKIPLS